LCQKKELPVDQEIISVVIYIWVDGLNQANSESSLKMKYFYGTRLQIVLFFHGSRLFAPVLVGLLVLSLSGCAAHKTSPQLTDARYVAVDDTYPDDLMSIFAPVFVLPEWQKSYNRIGKVIAEKSDGFEKIFIDPDRPIIYGDKFSFSTQSGRYTNLVYRVHFQKIPFSLIPFHFEAGSNVGQLVVVTLSEKHIPLLVTLVNTCGCYAVVLPTGALPVEAYPEDWVDRKQKVYGEILPASLPKYNAGDALLVTVRPEIHRAMDVSIAKWKTIAEKEVVPGKLMALQSLKRLPLEDGGVTSFYYDTWPLRGHVKGSIKLWESLLLSLVSFDFYVGMDKEYGDTVLSGNPFYTSLKVWNRRVSDMNDFARFLHFLGWKL
jgi:hypothetical protein